MDLFKREIEFYNKKRGELVASHEGKIVVIKGNTILGFYEDKDKAIRETMSKGHKLGTFLVRRVAKEDEVAIFRSRVVSSSG